MSKEYVVGADLGGTNVRAAVVDRQGNRIGEARTESKAMEGLSVTVNQIASAINGAIEDSNIPIDSIAGIGMGVPGTIKSHEGIVVWSPNFNNWDNVQLGKPISDATGLPVIMGNDANVAAFGEYSFGAGRGARVMVMLTLGTGVGSGLVIDGNSYLGVNEIAPEMGHHIIDPNGPRCGCGRFGCLEAFAGRDPICFRAAKKAHGGRYTSLIEKSEHDLRYITPSMIAEAALEGDEVSIETLNEVGFYLGIGISNIINILNPDRIVIGGGVSQAGDLLFDPIRRTIEVNALYPALQVCELVQAELLDDAGIMGGAGLAFQSFCR